MFSLWVIFGARFELAGWYYLINYNICSMRPSKFLENFLYLWKPDFKD